ncbi:MAG: protein phosphatase 2C domain-containing protein [Candidatus Aenigmarchaeota archaeon]|nr:protein phosphatase 2C domain-containing protein [Candidatus Aenigmarchaeota archaeon]
MKFQIAGGSIAGRDHRHPLNPHNNKDAFAWRTSEGATAIVVADGCSSGSHNEVGAKLGARLMVEALLRQWRRSPDSADILLEQAMQDLLAQIRVLAHAMGGSFSETIGDCFLFTLGGAVLTEDRSLVFSVGDPLIIVNGDVVRSGGYPGNEPPYPAYALLGDEPEMNRQVVSGVESVLIGTDGAEDFRAAEGAHVGTALIGPISQFWTQEQYFANPDSVRRTLALAAAAAGSPLHDDTTLVVARRWS